MGLILSGLAAGPRCPHRTVVDANSAVTPAITSNHLFLITGRVAVALPAVLRGTTGLTVLDAALVLPDDLRGDGLTGATAGLADVTAFFAAGFFAATVFFAVGFFAADFLAGAAAGAVLAVLPGSFAALDVPTLASITTDGAWGDHAR